MSEHTAHRWPRYPAYKDSGVGWLGEIPSHWDMRRLRFVGQVNPSKSETGYLPDDFEVSFLPMEAIGDDGTLVLEDTRTLDQVRQGYTYFRDRDVIVAKITPCFENGKGALCKDLLHGIGFGTTELYVLRPHSNTDPKFLFYLTFSKPFRKMGAATMYGAAGQKRVSENFIKDFSIGYPPVLFEQRAIAAFLDRETAKLDALIAKKQRLIELLHEQRSALISHAVTKGLDPSVPMRDSGIAWLGEIPSHWEVKRFKHLISYITSGSRGWAEYYSDEGPIFIRVGNVSGTPSIDLDLKDIQRVVPPQGTEGKRTRVEKDDVLIAITGATIGTVAVVENDIEEAYVNQHVALTRPIKRRCEPKWLGFSVYSSFGQRQVELLLTGGTKQGLGLDDVKNFFVAHPPREEQQEIVRFLERQNTQIDQLINEVRKAIEYLQEYRAALISAAVTGKIDVRKEVNP